MAGNRVDIAVLRRVCDQIFRFIEEDLRMPSVELDPHLYWTLPDEVRFNMATAPTAEHVGDLRDDYGFVEVAGQDIDQAVPLLLEHVAPLLAAIANKVPSSR